jgi:hypothetical protein
MKTTSPCYKLSRIVVDDHTPLDNLRLETTPACFYLVSYHHLNFAKFESTPEQDALTLTFLNQQVCITGKHLREMAVAIQGRAVEFIKPMPTRYGAVVNDEAGLVESIEVVVTGETPR